MNAVNGDELFNIVITPMSKANHYVVAVVSNFDGEIVKYYHNVWFAEINRTIRILCADCNMDASIYTNTNYDNIKTLRATIAH